MSIITQIEITEHERAKQWRLARNLSVPQLAELTGYASNTIYLFERGLRATSPNDPEGGPVTPWTWLRFKMAVAGVEAQLRAGRPFDWEAA